MSFMARKFAGSGKFCVRRDRGAANSERVNLSVSLSPKFLDPLPCDENQLVGRQFQHDLEFFRSHLRNPAKSFYSTVQQLFDGA